MNYVNPMGVEIRLVRDTLHDGQPARIVGGTRSYATDIRDLWEALTESDRIARWFLPISGDLRLGGRYQLEGNAGGEITRCEPPHALDVTWEFAGNVSWVTVRLDADGVGTRLKLEHIMLKDAAGEAHWDQYGPGATGVGWDLSFFGLGMHLDSGGEALDQDAVNAWMAADAGKLFIRECAQAWGDAHIETNAPENVARAMAQQTADAYTGN